MSPLLCLQSAGRENVVRRRTGDAENNLGLYLVLKNIFFDIDHALLADSERRPRRVKTFYAPAGVLKCTTNERGSTTKSYNVPRRLSFNCMCQIFAVIFLFRSRNVAVCRRQLRRCGWMTTVHCGTCDRMTISTQPLICLGDDLYPSGGRGSDGGLLYCSLLSVSILMSIKNF